MSLAVGQATPINDSKSKAITVEIGGNADGLDAVLDNLQQKADKLVATLEKAKQLTNSLNAED